MCQSLGESLKTVSTIRGHSQCSFSLTAAVDLAVCENCCRKKGLPFCVARFFCTRSLAFLWEMFTGVERLVTPIFFAFPGFRKNDEMKAMEVLPILKEKVAYLSGKDVHFVHNPELHLLTISPWQLGTQKACVTASEK